MRSVVYKINYFAIFVLIVTMMTMSLLAFALLHDPPLGKQLETVAQDTAQTQVHIGAMHYDEASGVATVESITIDNPEGLPPGPAMIFGKLTLQIDGEDTARHPIWGETKRKYTVSVARIDNVKIFLQVRPDYTNISALLHGLELAASVKYHTKPGRPPVTLVLGDIFAPKEFDIVSEDGTVTRIPSGPLKELLQINHAGGALASEAITGTIRAFGRAALTEAAKRNMLKGLNERGLAEITGAFNPLEQSQNRIREDTRNMTKRLNFFFRNL